MPSSGDDEEPSFPQPLGLPMVVGDMMLMAESQSSDRAAAVLPMEGSEDKRALLQQPDVPPPLDQEDYGPGGLEWVVDVTPAPGVLLSQEQVEQVFDHPWMGELGHVTLYGYSVEEERWTYFSGSEPDTQWERLAVATEVLTTYEEEPEPASERTLRDFLKAVQARAGAMTGVEVRARTEPVFAARRARAMFECWQRANEQCLVVLAGSAPFSGRDVWDVMMSLGLRWGDGDLFHWRNHGAVGDDQYFSVWTTSEPGYFLPEHIAAGLMNPEDLVFGFSIPRCAAPRHVFEQLLAAVRYARSRLGGTLRDGDFEPFDEQAERDKITRVLETLAEFGLEPGRDTTLRLF
jgi:cell division protein ZipA